MAKNKKDIDSYFSKDFLIFFGILSGFITLSLAIRIFQSDFRLFFSYAFLPIMCGMFFEQKRLGYSWKEILLKSFASYCIVSFVLLVSLQNYKTHSEIEISFPLSTFIISFVIISISYAYFLKKNQNITAKLSEGILLLQSISILYILFTNGFFNYLDSSKLLIIIPVIAICAYTFFHAFSSKIHTEKSKLYLSLWSSVITLIFSIIYFMKMFKVEISEHNNLEENILAVLQFFLFGISIIYTAQNAWLLVRFLPEKGESSESYKSRLKNLKQEHTERFSDTQIPVSSSLFCLIFVGGIYYLNYIYNWIPSYTMIWLVFTFFPFIIFYWEELTLKEK